MISQQHSTARAGLLARRQRLHTPARSTCCGVAQSGVKTSSGTESAMGRKEKIPPPLLLMSTTVSGGRISPAHSGIGVGRWAGEEGLLWQPWQESQPQPK